MEQKDIIIANMVCIMLLGGMYVYSANVTPENVDIGDIGGYVGKYVSISGIVTKVKNESSGCIIIVGDEQMVHSVMVFVSFHPPVFPGSYVRAMGIVEKYSNSYEIMVKNAGDIRILKRSYDTNLEILLKNPEYFTGFRLRIHGNITSAEKTDRYIHITDGFNTTWIYVDKGYRGERRAYFYGVVRNGMLYVENVSLRENRIYSNVSIGELSEHEGEYVGIYGKILNYGGYAYIVDGKYRLRAFFRGEVRNEGDVYVEGIFEYNEHNGEYELICN